LRYKKIQIGDLMRKIPSRQKPEATIAIVGSGRLGTALGIALTRSGYRIQAVMARRVAHARNAAALIRRDSAALAANQLGLLPLCSIVLISTPDDQIEPIAQRLARELSRDGLPAARGRTVLHTSGALSSAVLAPLAEIGFRVGSLHPLVSVSEPTSGAEALRGAFYSVEGDAAAVRVARGIVRALEGRSFSIPSNRKPLYHAAAVMTSGHVVALFDLAIELLVHCGLKQKQARQVLLPLLESTVNNLLTSDVAHALTGTFARGDLATVQRHLQALADDKSADAFNAYALLGAHSLELAKSIDPKTVTKIKRALNRAAAQKK
jgi:predicted short-subunit dehydrogenase-like oxidoreductase (DUF2520 family)